MEVYEQHKLMAERLMGSHMVFLSSPDSWFSLGNDFLLVMVVVSAILTAVFNYEQYEDNPLERMFGYPNICIVFDTEPARFVAAPVWSFVIFCYLIFVFEDTKRLSIWMHVQKKCKDALPKQGRTMGQLLYADCASSSDEEAASDAAKRVIYFGQESGDVDFGDEIPPEFGLPSDAPKHEQLRKFHALADRYALTKQTYRFKFAANIFLALTAILTSLWFIIVPTPGPYGVGSEILSEDDDGTWRTMVHTGLFLIFMIAVYIAYLADISEWSGGLPFSKNFRSNVPLKLKLYLVWFGVLTFVGVGVALTNKAHYKSQQMEHRRRLHGGSHDETYEAVNPWFMFAVDILWFLSLTSMKKFKPCQFGPRKLLKVQFTLADHPNWEPYPFGPIPMEPANLGDDASLTDAARAKEDIVLRTLEKRFREMYATNLRKCPVRKKGFLFNMHIRPISFQLIFI